MLSHWYVIKILINRSSAKMNMTTVVFRCGPGFHEAWIMDQYGEEPIVEFLKASSKHPNSGDPSTGKLTC